MTLDLKFHVIITTTTDDTIEASWEKSNHSEEVKKEKIKSRGERWAHFQKHGRDGQRARRGERQRGVGACTKKEKGRDGDERVGFR